MSPRASSGSAAAKRSSASGAAVSTTVPDGSTKLSERSVMYESRTTPQRMPPELLAITPPTVAASVLAGSGPSLRWWRASTALASPRTVPGRTRASAPPSSTLTPRQWRRTSTTRPSPCAWPLRLVPAARSVTGSRCSRAKANTLRTSATSRAMTTAWGSRR